LTRFSHAVIASPGLPSGAIRSGKSFLKQPRYLVVASEARQPRMRDRPGSVCVRLAFVPVVLAVLDVLGCTPSDFLGSEAKQSLNLLRNVVWAESQRLLRFARNDGSGISVSATLRCPYLVLIKSITVYEKSRLVVPVALYASSSKRCNPYWAAAGHRGPRTSAYK